jgi:hypothetical protein
VGRDTNVVTKLPNNYFSGRLAHVSESADNRARQQQDFDQAIDQIRGGMHLGWLKHLAFIYYGIYSDTDRNLSPRERLAAWLYHRGLHRLLMLPTDAQAAREQATAGRA